MVSCWLAERWVVLALAPGVCLGPAWTAHVAAVAPARETLAVLQPRTTAIDAGVREVLAAVVEAEAAARLGRRHILAGPQLAQPVQQRARLRSGALARCTEVDCLVEIGRALGAHQVLVTHVGRVGRTYAVHVELVDPHRGQVLRQAHETISGPQEEVLAGLRRRVAEVLGALGLDDGEPSGGHIAPAAKPEAAWPAYASAALLTAGAVAAGTSIVLGLRSERQGRDADSHVDGSQRELVQARQDRRAANSAAGLGAVAAVAGLAVWWLTAADEGGSVELIPAVTQQAAGVLLRASY